MREHQGTWILGAAAAIPVAGKTMRHAGAIVNAGANVKE